MEFLVDDTRLLIVADRVADLLDERMTRRLIGKQRNSSKVNQYGGKGTIKFGATSDDVRAGIREEETLIDWSSPDGEPQAVTIELGILAKLGGGTYPLSAIGGVPLGYRAQGLALIGTPAVMMDPFFFDVGRGRRFMVSASYVAVTAQMIAPAPGYLSGSLAIYGALGLGGTFSGSESLYSTLYIDSLQINETRNLTIPSRAVTVEDFLTQVLANFTLNVLDASGRVLRGIATTGASSIGTRAGGVSLSGDAAQIQIINNGPTVVNAELLFGLLL